MTIEILPAAHEISYKPFSLAVHIFFYSFDKCIVDIPTYTKPPPYSL